MLGGLSLARSLVELHGGSIHVAGEGLGHGSEFVLTLPECEALEADECQNVDPVQSSSEKQGRRILIVDDNVEARTSLARLLSVASHECQIAKDGQEALDVALRFAPDVFLIDLGMPTMSGYELASRLRQSPQFGSSLFIAVTG